MWTGEGLRHGTPPQSGGEAVTAPFIVIKPFLPDPNFVQEIGAPGALARFWTRVEAGISRCCLTLPRAVADQAGLDLLESPYRFPGVAGAVRPTPTEC